MTSELKDKVRISVVIPAFNVEDYIVAALDSLHEQTVLPDEIIVIDDGSSDRTLELLNTYAFKVPSQIVSKQNEGQGIARNIGLDKASGDYVYFFDADDLLKPNFIKEMHDVLRGNDFPSILFFAGESFYEGERHDNVLTPDYRRGFEGRFPNREAFLKALAQRGSISCSPCLYISKKSMWTDNELKFKSYYHEDEEILFPLIFACTTFVVRDTIYFRRRIRPNSTMTIRRTDSHIAGIRATIDTLTELKRTKDVSKLGVRLINKRIHSFSISYVNASIQVGRKIDWLFLWQKLLEIKSLKFGIQVIARFLFPSRFGLRHRNK
ncbi:glycosyltransferase family 2 protein [Pseudidiomarina homiensis]|uniref:Glycosyltransferase 2-like domain-containing protein n=1 Tax=Pseudidiomarina homiensis TaxID=364198 RepID=A0A432Y5I7_9GAMM|nr:glycosyltransferase family 2 protein [Pseudidiomarina homiensis]RUO56240.1 hypothetical protein CWI70_05675 [Pseudidiomarina homiensis]